MKSTEQNLWKVAMAKSFSMPTYVVYVDTNTAYSKKPSEPISNRVHIALRKARELTGVEARIPQVVCEELIFQQFQIARAATENLEKNSKTLKDVCGTCNVAVPDRQSLEASIRKQFEDSAAKASLVCVPTPVADIDWNQVVHDSCWRHPPFEKPASEDDLAEKGFRDRIIIETIKHDARSVRDCVVAFISADSLTRTTFEKQAQLACPIEVYDRIEAFIGHLELLSKTKSNEFVETVLSKAASTFYDATNPRCVAISLGVLDHLMKEYAEEMAQPSILQVGFAKTKSYSTFSQPLAAANMYTGNWFDEIKQWGPVTPLAAFAAPPIFQSGYTDGRYHWTSTITLVRLLRRSVPRDTRIYQFPEERIRVKEIEVTWSCKIDPNTAEFSEFAIDDYAPTFKDSFIEADISTRSNYNLPLIPGMTE